MDVSLVNQGKDFMDMVLIGRMSLFDRFQMFKYGVKFLFGFCSSGVPDDIFRELLPVQDPFIGE